MFQLFIPGHVKKDCPTLAKYGQMLKANAFDIMPSFIKGDAWENGKNLVLEDIILVCNVTFSCFFDTGASHSFITSNFVDRLNHKLDILYNLY